MLLLVLLLLMVLFAKIILDLLLLEIEYLLSLLSRKIRLTKIHHLLERLR